MRSTLKQIEADRSIKRIKSLLIEDISQQEMVDTLNSEGYKTISGKRWSTENLRVVLFRLRHEEKTWYGLSQVRANLTQQLLA